MKRTILVTMILLAPWPCWQAASAGEVGTILPSDKGSVAYQRAERQYYDLGDAYLASESMCPTRTAKVVEKQKILASSVAHLSAKDGGRVLLFAVTANDLTDAGRLLAEGAARTGDNGSLLHAAATFGDAPLLEMLVDAGFGIEDLGGASGPALMAAVSSGRKDNAEWLIRHGANVNARTVREGAPVLMYALICKDQSLVSELIRAGARPDAKTTLLLQRRESIFRADGAAAKTVEPIVKQVVPAASWLRSQERRVSERCRPPRGQQVLCLSAPNQGAAGSDVIRHQCRRTNTE